MRKPNILWICTDQQRFDTLGCYGNRFVRTPNIDRLAAEGVRFANAFVQSPVCTPSRASFLTGRYPRLACRQNGADIPEREVLVTKVLADAGYHNGLSGKLHLSAVNGMTGRYEERRIDDGYADFHWSHHSSGMGRARNEYHEWLSAKGQAWTTRKSDLSRFISHATSGEMSQTAWCAEKATDFIRARAADGRPWLFSVNMFDPHHDFDAPKEYLERYLQILETIPLPNHVPGELDGKPAWQKIDHGGAYGHPGWLQFDTMTDTDHRLVTASYWAMCDLIDDHVGAMVRALEETGQRENTMIIFTSDHGEMLGDHGIYLKGPYFYEPAIHVPLIVNWPGRVRAGVSEALVELTDLAPTILDAAGLPRHPGMQGRSLWPILTGAADAGSHRDDIYCEFYNACEGHNGSNTAPAFATMLRTARYKLVRAHNLGTGELYDLEQDPRETVNRWNDPTLSEVKIDLLTRLSDRMAYTVDPLPARTAPW
jgi:choline-sulfatase